MSFNRLGSGCVKESKAGWGGTIVDHHQVGNSLEELNVLDWPAVNPEDKCTLGGGGSRTEHLARLLALCCLAL